LLVTCKSQSFIAKSVPRTLNVSDALLQNLLQDLGVLELLLDLGDDGSSQLLLLSLLNLALVADPGVEDSLGLSSQGSLLLELESLSLKLGSLLHIKY
jgi:hypothetical protein